VTPVTQNMRSAPSKFSLISRPFVVFFFLRAIAGCGGSVTPATVTTTSSNNFSGSGFSGKAKVGTQPLIGASVQIFAAGSSGSGSPGIPLLSSSLTTDANGAFTIPAGYPCPSATSQLYLLAEGGKPASTASNNPAISLLTALGSCSQILPTTQVVINEATTVAAAYGLSQFLLPGGSLGASSTNTIGLQNAIATANALVDITSGTSPGPNFAANGSSPAAIINSIANLLLACTSSSSGTPCTSLFFATTGTGGSVPTNTLDAVLNLVRNPATNVTTLFNLSTAAAAYSPKLSAAPPDWSLYVNYTGGGMSGPSGGNIWVASYFNVASLFSPLGKPLFAQGITGFGLSASYGLAVAANNNAWIPNEPSTGVAGNSVTVIESNGQSAAGASGFTGAGLDYPVAVAIDTDSTVWVVDFGNSHLTHLSSSGQALSGTSGYTSSTLAFPVAAALDSNHNVWIANQGGTTVTKMSPDGSQFSSYSCCDSPVGLAIDRSGNVWAANYYGDSISEISNAGTALINGSITGGGLNHPQAIAIDGSGTVWVANYRGPSLTEIAGSSAASPGAVLSPATGLGSGASLQQAYAIAVDPSGNLWVTNFASNTLTEFVGLATPVKTPLLGPPTLP
jgi:streptogramin lyase